MTKDEALKMALEALEWCHGGEPCGTANAIVAIKKVLEQPPEEPVFTYEQVKAHIQAAMMSTTPPQRKPLTDEQEREAFEAWANPSKQKRFWLGEEPKTAADRYAWSAWKARSAHNIKE